MFCKNHSTRKVEREGEGILILGDITINMMNYTAIALLEVSAEIWKQKPLRFRVFFVFKNNSDSSEMTFQYKNPIKILHYDARDALFLL